MSSAPPSETQNSTLPGNGQASGNELVSFPGAYKDNDKGIFFPDAFNPNTDYPFPGPRVAALVASSSSNSNTTSSPAAASGAANSNTSPSTPISPRDTYNLRIPSTRSFRIAPDRAKARSFNDPSRSLHAHFVRPALSYYRNSHSLACSS
ncbi:hypothetical protein BDN71DRAFT_1429853 [Pleurotus eryngii]|uniref:Uncharacterized protein n=1 Tax=Pleurotus eryngii TaxID=5323 RepID=A0A9P6DA39_PLEER|nr:hypothetical protein BDN71DRAFT_1429853 [Pleurotus eryngii]